jgi:hypothetical protein
MGDEAGGRATGPDNRSAVVDVVAGREVCTGDAECREAPAAIQESAKTDTSLPEDADDLPLIVDA